MLHPEEARQYPCVECGELVLIYPPEDGDGERWRCGHCAESPSPVEVTDPA